MNSLLLFFGGFALLVVQVWVFHALTKDLARRDRSPYDVTQSIIVACLFLTIFYNGLHIVEVLHP